MSRARKSPAFVFGSIVASSAFELVTDGLFPWALGLCALQFYLRSRRAFVILIPLVIRAICHTIKHVISSIERTAATAATNQRRALRVVAGTVEEVNFEAIGDGDVVCIDGGHDAPADVIVLWSEEGGQLSAVVHIETISVDGEPGSRPRRGIVDAERLGIAGMARQQRLHWLAAEACSATIRYERSVDYSEVWRSANSTSSTVTKMSEVSLMMTGESLMIITRTVTH